MLETDEVGISIRYTIYEEKLNQQRQILLQARTKVYYEENLQLIRNFSDMFLVCHQIVEKIYLVRFRAKGKEIFLFYFVYILKKTLLTILFRVNIMHSFSHSYIINLLKTAVVLESKMFHFIRRHLKQKMIFLYIP